MSGRRGHGSGKRSRTQTESSREDPTEPEDTATPSSDEGTTPHKSFEKAHKRVKALHPAHVQRSVNALADLVGNLYKEQKRPRQEIDELKSNH